MKLRITMLIILCLIIVSCSKSFLEDDANLAVDTLLPEAEFSPTYDPNLVGHKIRYSITGDILGKVNFYFAQTDGGNAPYGNLNGTAVPWDFTYQEPDSIYAVAGFAIGDISAHNGYEYGPLVTSDIDKVLVFQFYVDDKLHETSIRKINEDGFVVIGTQNTYELPIYYLDKPLRSENFGKEIHYQASGTYSGTLYAHYMIADGSWEDVEITLPYEYSFTVGNDSKMGSLSVYGLDTDRGKLDETLTLSLFVDGESFDMQTTMVDKQTNGPLGGNLLNFIMYDE